MKYTSSRAGLLLLAGILVVSCARNPYATTNRSYKKQAKAYARTLKMAPLAEDEGTLYPQGNYWVGTTNFNMRKPNYVVIHHTAQDSTTQTLKTFTIPKTQVSAHYVIGRDGKVYHMLNDYLRAWHGGVARWGNNTDLNSSSIGIELDNNGYEPFSEAQINSLLEVLAMLKKKYSIPATNFIGHSDIAPTRKDDPNAMFPWKKLAENGFGLWYDEAAVDSAIVAAVLPDTTQKLNMAALLPDSSILKNVAILDSLAKPIPVPDPIQPKEALHIIGYDTRNMPAAIKSFKLHFIQTNVDTTLTATDKQVLFNLYKKYL
ncbi:N-acetylmuramoyl-L-alanine amidase [Pontibacter chitinilyticus]|uniref:N-acetylmuramoyl-L-alanine amidase n=1 Tax=Pontibacter chitinilyticus TaxID=2674989 RepID=UPI00321B94D0